MKKRLQEGVKAAMRAKDKLRLETLRGLLSTIQYEEIQRKVSELPEESVIVLLKSEVKKRGESLQFAKEAGRAEMVSQLEEEIKIVEEFLPSQLDREQLSEILNDFKAANPNSNMGAAMKELKEKYPAQYDGKLASQIAKEIFG